MVDERRSPRHILRILDREEPVVQPHFRRKRVRRRHPVQRGFHAAAVRRVTAARGRVVRAPQLHDVARIVLDHISAHDEVGTSQPYLLPRREPEELLRRIFAEVVLLYVEHASERHLSRAGTGILGVVDDVDLFNLAVGIVREHDLQRMQHRHHARRAPVQILADAVLELCDVDDVFLFRDANARAEVAERLGRVAATAQPGNRRHAWVVPARHVSLLHELQQLPLAHHGVIQIEAGELVLPRLVTFDQIVDQPVVQRPMIFELERADRMRDPLDRIRQRVREVVHRIDAPRVARPVMRGVADPVQRRIAHVQVR